jgi:predicted DCC family thiol-disulfide oxidoreductase YuxK
MFYDGGCPLCRREVAHYRRLEGAQRIDWIDIDANREALMSAGIDHRTAMQRLHVRDRHGNLRSGGAAFLALWDELPRYRWLARAVRLFRLSAPLESAYAAFARRRYRHRCANGACRVEPRTCPADR